MLHKNCSKFHVLFMCADMCMDYVEGRMNSEIVSSLSHTNDNGNCSSCNSDSDCINCILPDCNKAPGGVTTCFQHECVCQVFPP